MVALRWSDRLIGVGSLAVLARLLTPDDFGVLAFAMIVIGVLEVFTGLSIDSALIRDQQAGAADYDAGWTLNVIKGAILSLLVLLLAAPAAAYFAEPRLDVVMWCLAVVPLLDGLGNIGTVEFRKRLQFRREFAFLFVTRITSTALTIALAIWLQNYWALVAGTTIRSALRLGVSYFMQDYRPRLSVTRLAHIFRFSRWMLVQQCAAGLNARVPELFVGRLVDGALLACFNIGREIATLATSELRAPIRRALFPGLARFEHDRARLASALVGTTGLMAIVTLPIPLGIALTAEDLVPLLLGPSWGRAVPFMQVIGIAATLGCLGTNSFLAFMVLNRPYLTAVAALIRLAFLVPATYFLIVRYGAIGAAYAMVLSDVVALVVDYAFSARLCGIALARLFAVIWRPVVGASAMLAAVLWLHQHLPAAATPQQHVQSLLLSAIVGAAVYTSCVLLLWRLFAHDVGPERQVLSLLGIAWKREPARRPGAAARPGRCARPALQAPAILAFGTNPWCSYWQTRQQVLSRLAKRDWRVAYTTPVMSRWDLGQATWQAAPWFTGMRDEQGVAVYAAGRTLLRTPRWPVLDRATLRSFVRAYAARVVADGSRPIIAYVFNPIFWPYLEFLGDCKVVFHADDNFSAMGRWTTQDAAMQDALVARADLIFATTEGVARSLNVGAGDKLWLMPNGADAGMFRAGRQFPCSADLAALPRPRLGYAGGLNDKVDFALIAELATARPQWHWVLIGHRPPIARLAPRTQQGLAQCLALPNVHFLPAKPHDELPACHAHMDVNVMCYRVDGDGWWRDIYPLKLHEYLASGPPVVSTDLPAVRPFADVVALCCNREQWLAAIAEALATGGRGSAERRLAVAEANSWDVRVDAIERHLRAL